MKSWLAKICSVAALGVGVVVIPAPAWADWDDCSSARLCLYHNQDGEGDWFSRTSSDNDLGGDSDEAHSVWNRSQVAWLLYDDKDYSDRVLCIRSRYAAADLGDYSFGDKISSVKKRSSDTCAGYSAIGNYMGP